MCGKNSKLLKAEIERVVMDVCSDCAKFGKRVFTPTPIETKKLEVKKTQPKSYSEIETKEVIRDNFNSIIHKKREELGLKQEELAKMLAVKESLLSKIEQGSIRPSLELAKKLEKKLNIKLVDEIKETKFISGSEDKDTMTLGDIIKIKKK